MIYLVWSNLTLEYKTHVFIDFTFFFNYFVYFYLARWSINLYVDLYKTNINLNKVYVFNSSRSQIPHCNKI